MQTMTVSNFKETWVRSDLMQDIRLSNAGKI